MFKPKIKYVGSIKQWKCSGGDIDTFDCKPSTAYTLWRIAYDKQKYMERKGSVYEGTKGSFKEFYPLMLYI